MTTLCRAVSLLICASATILGIAEAREYSCVLMDDHRAIIALDQAPSLSFSHLANPVVVTSTEVKDEGIMLQGYVLSEDAVDMNARRARLCGTPEGQRVIEADGSAMPCGFMRKERFMLNFRFFQKEQRATVYFPDKLERSLFIDPAFYDVYKDLNNTFIMSCAATKF